MAPEEGAAGPGGQGSAVEVMDLLVRAAALLFENGQTTERTVAAVERLAETLHFKAIVFLHWGDLRIHCASRTSSLSSSAAASPVSIDMGKVAAATGMIAAVSRGEIAASVRELGARLKAIDEAPPTSALRFIAFTAAGAAALGIIFGAVDVACLALIAGSAGLGAALRRWIARWSADPYLPAGSAALLAGLIGAIASRLHLSPLPRLVMVCPCMVLIPGAHLLNGALDLARMRVVLGTGRLVYVSVIVLAICMGLLVGLALGGASLPASGSYQPVAFVWDVLAAGVAVAAYGTFFAMPWRLLPIPMAIGMLAHALRWIVISWGGAGLEAGALAASLVVGAIVTPVANRLNLPFAALGFASVVSLIPGVFVFGMAGELTEAVALGARAPSALWSGVAADAAKAFMITLAIATGLILPKMLLDRFSPDGPQAPAEERSSHDPMRPYLDR